MVIRRLTSEWAARLLLVILIVSLIMAVMIGGQSAHSIEIHAVMPEKGGWLPGVLTAEVGVPLNLRLTSDDVMHGFAVGQQPWPAVDLKPGQMTKVSITFDKPGTYTYYCTRWCGPNHWRMRGTIEVNGEQSGSLTDKSYQQPHYISLGLDIDAPHEVDVQMDRPPSAVRGKNLSNTIPSWFNAQEAYLEKTPYSLWQELRADPGTADLSDKDLWDLIAFVWRSQTTPESLELGQRLYVENCAACHGGEGNGAGLMAATQTAKNETESLGHTMLPPADFTDPQKILGASSALLQGKIIRGGMGTGMPYWGTIFTNDEVQALVDYLWTFQFLGETEE